VNSQPDAGVELVASKSKPYFASSGVNFNPSFCLKFSEFTFIIRDATFSFTLISTLDLKGRTSVYHFEFLLLETTSKKTEKFHSSLNM